MNCKQCNSQTSGSDYCDNCTTAFANSLRSLSTMLPDLRLIAAKRARVTARQHGGGNRSVAPIPMNMDAFQLQEDIIRFADMLGKALTLHYNRHMPAESLLKAATSRTPTLLKRRDSQHIIAIATRYRRQIVMQLTPPEDKRLIGICPSCHRDQWCTDTDVAGQWIVCKCGQTLKVRDIQEQHLLTCALASGEHAQGTAAGISKLLKVNGIDVKRNTINQWYRRRILHAIGDYSGTPVFRVWDVWKALIR